MNIFQSVTLGIIQGLTEFFPVSSSGHLILLPKIFGWEAHSLSLDAFLHLGTGLAVLVYFRKEWVRMARSVASAIRNPRTALRWTEDTDYGLRLTVYIFIASFPAALAGVFLNSWVESNLRSPQIVATSLFTVAILMIVAQNTVGTVLQRLSLWRAVGMGFSQVLALIPGVSRSGITITTGFFSGLDLASAARFSFLLSTPIVLGAGIWGLIGMPQTALRIPQITAGFFAAFFSGILAIKIFLGFVEKVGLLPFAVYRILLAAAVLFFAI